MNIIFKLERMVGDIRKRGRHVVPCGSARMTETFSVMLRYVQVISSGCFGSSLRFIRVKIIFT